MVILAGIGLFACGFVTAALLIRLGVKALCKREDWILASRIENTNSYKCHFTGAMLEFDDNN